jgi:hypothetical protein
LDQALALSSGDKCVTSSLYLRKSEDNGESGGRRQLVTSGIDMGIEYIHEKERVYDCLCVESGDGEEQNFPKLFESYMLS